MRIVKWVAWILGGLVALLVVGAVLVVLFVDPNDYRDDIERAVERSTGRDLELTGELKLSVFPWISLQTGAASLGEAPGFGPEPFVAVKETSVSVRFWPLLRGKVEAGKIRLVGARVRLITDEQGRNNWADLGRQQAAPAEPVPTEPMQLPTVSGLEIVDATLVQENRQLGVRRLLSKFNLETGRIASGDPFDLKTNFQYQHSPELMVSTQLAARITADPPKQLYMLDDADIALTLKGPTYPAEGMPIKIVADKIQSDLKQNTHTLEDFALTTRWKAKDAKTEGLPIELTTDSLTANMQAQTMKLSDLAVKLADAQLKGNVQGTEILDAPHLTGTLQLPQTSLKALLAQAGVVLPVTRDPKAYERLSFEGAIDVTRTSAAIDKAVLKLDDTTARGSLGIADFASKAVRFDLSVDRIDADRYRAPEPTEAEAKAAQTQSKEPATPAPIPVELLRTLNLRGDLKVGEAKFAGMTFSDLQLGVNARNGQLKLQPLAAKMYEGRYRGEVNVDATGDVARIGMQQQVEGVNFAPLLKDGFETTRISGKGNANLQVTAAGRTTDALLNTLDGTMDFAVNEGALEGADLWYEIRRARSVLKREAIPARSGPARTTFDTLKGTGTFDNGVLSNNDLEAATQYLRVKGQGAVNLPQNTLDYRLNTIIMKIPREGADTSQMTDMVDAEIPVRVTGPLNDPKVRPDIEGYLKGEAKQRLEKEKDKVEEKVKGKLQDKLKDILGGGRG